MLYNLTRVAVNAGISAPRRLCLPLQSVSGQASRCMSDEPASPSIQDDALNNEENREPSLGEKCMNSVTLLGRVGNDPQLRGTSVHPVVSFPLATNYRYRPGGAGSDQPMVSRTEWHNISVFRPGLRDNVLNNVSKGKRIFVQGRLMYGSVEDKLGNVRHTTTIVAEDIIRFA